VPAAADPTAAEAAVVARPPARAAQHCGIPRREALAGLISAAVLLASAACSPKAHLSGAQGRSPAPSAPPDPDLALIADLRSGKQDLIKRYDAVIGDHPTLGGRLTPFRTDHVAHLEALGGSASGGIAPGGDVLTPSPRPSPNETESDRAPALSSLAAAERAAATARPTQCRGAHAPALARLIAAIGGCEAAHDALLTALASKISEAAETSAPGAHQHPRTTPPTTARPRRQRPASEQ
jgi:hypothetical protein